MWRQALAVVALIAMTSQGAAAAHLHKEKEYQSEWCEQAGGVQEYVLDDGARVDCLTDEYAIEFDFAPKWAESIGQALYYAEKTGRRPGVVLILERAGEEKLVDRLLVLAARYDIMTWVMHPADLVTIKPPAKNEQSGKMSVFTLKSPPKFHSPLHPFQTLINKAISHDIPENPTKSRPIA